MKKRKFTTQNLENLYQHLITTPPLDDNNSRLHGSAIREAFWAGYDGIKNNRQVPTSFSEAAYWAGQDYKTARSH